MTILDLFAVMAIVCGVALVVMAGHAVWSIMHDDLRWFSDELEDEDEHIRDLPAPWSRGKK